jgi:hypothetical protein
VVLPKYLLKAAMSESAADYQHLLRDNYENPYYTPELGNREFELQQLEMVLKLGNFRPQYRVFEVAEADAPEARRLLERTTPSSCDLRQQLRTRSSLNGSAQSLGRHLL